MPNSYMPQTIKSPILYAASHIMQFELTILYIYPIHSISILFWTHFLQSCKKVTKNKKDLLTVQNEWLEVYPENKSDFDFLTDAGNNKFSFIFLVFLIVNLKSCIQHPIVFYVKFMKSGDRSKDNIIFSFMFDRAKNEYEMLFRSFTFHSKLV